MHPQGGRLDHCERGLSAPIRIGAFIHMHAHIQAHASTNPARRGKLNTEGDGPYEHPFARRPGVASGSG